MNNKQFINELFDKNIKLVGYCFKKYIKLYNHSDFEDIIQEGNLELCRCCTKFDPDRGINFSTYAVPCITGAMKRYLREKQSVIRVPKSILDSNNPDEISLIRNPVSLDNNINKETESDMYNIIPTTEDDYEFESEDLVESVLKLIENPTHRNIMEEYWYYTMFGDGCSQRYLMNKYKVSQSYISRIIEKYNKILKSYIKENK